jgi:hypothetical protein
MGITELQRKLGDGEEQVPGGLCAMAWLKKEMLSKERSSRIIRICGKINKIHNRFSPHYD